MGVFLMVLWAACDQLWPAPSGEPGAEKPQPPVEAPRPAVPAPEVVPEPAPEPAPSAAPVMSVSLDKQNVLYIGVDNPLTLSASGVSTDDVTLSGEGAGLKLTDVGSGRYSASVSEPGPVEIRAQAEGLPPTTFAFRAKRIPDPVAMLSNKRGGSMGNGEFKAQGGVLARLEGFDFDAICTVQGFQLVYLARRQDPVESSNSGARYNSQA